MRLVHFLGGRCRASLEKRLDRGQGEQGREGHGAVIQAELEA